MIEKFAGARGLFRSEFLARFPPPVAKAGFQDFATHEGGGPNATSLARPSASHPAHATGELSSMAFEVGVEAPRMPPVTPT